MSDMTSTSNKSRRQVSHEQDLQNFFLLCNIVANVSVVAAEAELRQRQLQRKSTANVIRAFRARKRRFVEDIYKELEPVFFRRAYRMQYCNFETLADELRPYVVSASGGKKNVHQDLFQMDQFYQMSALHVRCDGSLQLHHMTS